MALFMVKPKIGITGSKSDSLLLIKSVGWKFMGDQERGMELKAELDRILAILSEKVCPEKVILFGSLASGKLTPESDIDLLIIQNSSESIFERVRKLEGLLDRRYAADLIVLTPEEVKTALAAGNRYLKQILTHGKVLYERAA